MFVRIAVTTAVLAALHSVPAHVQASDNDSATFDWNALEPKTTIEWTPCYTNQTCARVILPLDYDTPDGPTTAVALRMLPATDKVNYRGTIFLNPGGPGVPGTDLLEAATATYLSTIVGPSFDLLAFDPRGVGWTTPQAPCFDSDSQREIWTAQEGYSLLNASDPSLGLFRARARALAKRCEDKHGGEWGIGRFMGTMYVARDMLEISQMLGQEQLQYWGFSYGTVLGQYFAAMYPDKVKRMVIDGVYQAEDYRATLWSTNIVDIDKVVQSLFDYCHTAGPKKCALYEPDSAEIRARYFKVLDDVERNPVEVALADPPVVITRKALIQQLFHGTYSPIGSFPTIVETIYAIETRNETALTALAPNVVSAPVCQCGNASAPTISNEDGPQTFLISCGDGDPHPFDVETYKAYYKGLEEKSHLMAPMWAHLYLQCSEWRIRPKARYTGPLEARAGNATANPILLASALYDPVTPLADARKVRERYEGAGLLVQNSVGHTSMSTPSVCSAKYVRRYFENGTLPEEGATCEPDILPFVGKTEQDLAARGVSDSEEDVELRTALEGLSKVLPVFGHL